MIAFILITLACLLLLVRSRLSHRKKAQTKPHQPKATHNHIVDDSTIIYNFESQIQQIAKASGKQITREKLNACAQVAHVSTQCAEKLHAIQAEHLQASLFEEYKHMHYQSVQNADLAFQQLRMLQPVYLQIRNSPMTNRRQRQEMLDTVKGMQAILKQRYQDLNRNSGSLRDRIAQECGQQGREWYISLRRRTNRAKTKNKSRNKPRR